MVLSVTLVENILVFDESQTQHNSGNGAGANKQLLYGVYLTEMWPDVYVELQIPLQCEIF